MFLSGRLSTIVSQYLTIPILTTWNLCIVIDLQNLSGMVLSVQQYFSNLNLARVMEAQVRGLTDTNL